MNWIDAKSASVMRIAICILKSKVEFFYFTCDEENAAATHDELIRAEWRLRAMERQK